MSHYEAWFQISKRNKYSVGFVFATINLFLCCHENLLVPTHTQSQREIEIQLVCFVEKPSSNLRIFKPTKNTKELYMTSSTHDLMKDRNNQGLQCNLCFLSKFRQPCLLSAKTTSCVVSYNMYKILHYYQEHMNWWLLFNIMKKDIKGYRWKWVT